MELTGRLLSEIRFLLPKPEEVGPDQQANQASHRAKSSPWSVDITQLPRTLSAQAVPSVHSNYDDISYSNSIIK
jgi:hypothetical protein